MNLDAYFHRIGYNGDLAPTLENITNLVIRHTHSIAFENLNPLLGWPVALDLPSLEQKLIHERRGGYCFEQNTMFRQVLGALGVPVKTLAARVLWNWDGEEVAPRSHMLILAEIEGETYLVDVGFRVQALTPLRLVPNLEQPTSHGLCRFLQTLEHYMLQLKIRDTWRDAYRFDLSEHFSTDYEVYNWYTSTHPDSLFTKNLVASLAMPGYHYSLLNNQLTTHHVGGTSEKQTLADVDQLKQTLTEKFGIRLPETPPLDEVLGQFFHPAGNAVSA
ncbi:MAG: arylamine N-acetyltransferase [Pirellulaceae bacterium]